MLCFVLLIHFLTIWWRECSIINGLRKDCGQSPSFHGHAAHADTIHLRIFVVIRPVAQGVLRVRKILFCRLFQPMPDFLSVRDEQPAVPIQQSQEVFGMDIAVLCQLLQISHRLVPLIERQLAVFDLGP